MTKWIELRHILLDETKLSWKPSELDYLEHAFNRCEELWEFETSRIETPKLVIIGEAPLFGESEKYIYSAKVPQSLFLYASNFPEGPAPSKMLPLEKKALLLERMVKHGVIVIDAFPYALNSKSTPTMDFRKMGSALYKRLLDRAFHEHAAAKLLRISSQASDVKIAVRYARTVDAIGGALNAERLGNPLVIGKQGGGIDKVKFRSLLR